jgi:hypothetical protein
MLRVQSRALRPWRRVRSQVRSVFRQAPAQILRSICMNADTRQNLSRRSNRQRQSIGPSDRAPRNGQRRRGFRLCGRQRSRAETAVAASRRRVREQAEDHSIRKDLGLASGRERPPREGRGADFRAAEGVAHAPVALAAHWWDERHGRHRAPSVREWLRHLQSLERATYDCELLLASDAVG